MPEPRVDAELKDAAQSAMQVLSFRILTEPGLV